MKPLFIAFYRFFTIIYTNIIILLNNLIFISHLYMHYHEQETLKEAV